MKKLYYLCSLIAVFLFLSTFIQAQSCGATGGGTTASVGNFVGSGNLNFNSVFRGRFQNRTYAQISASYSSTKGSPYMFKEFADATLTLNNDTEVTGVKVNYDGFVGEIIAIDKDGEKIALDPRYYKKIVVDEGDAWATFERSNPEKEAKFYQVLYNKNSLVFYKDYQAKFHEQVANGLIETPARFSKKSQYYIMNGDDKPIAVNLKKKEVFEHFPEIELIAMEEIIKKKKYKMKKESDYLALFAQL